MVQDTSLTSFVKKLNRESPLIDKLSQLWDLFGFKILNIRVISSSSVVTFSINLFVLTLNGDKKPKSFCF